MKQILLLFSFVSICLFFCSDRGTKDLFREIPLGTVTPTLIGEQLVPNHSIMFVGSTRFSDSMQKVIRVVQAKGSLCLSVDSLAHSGIAYCNVTTIRFHKRVFYLAPHHVVSVIGNVSQLQDIELFMKNSGWQRVAQTELYLSEVTPTPKKIKNIPEIASIDSVVGDTVSIEGVQFNRGDAPCAHLMTMRGVLFRLPKIYYDTLTKKLTTSKLYGIKVPYAKDSASFAGLSGSPVLYHGKVIGIQIECSASKQDKLYGRAVLTIQPVLSPDMTLFFNRKKSHQKGLH